MTVEIINFKSKVFCKVRKKINEPIKVFGSKKRTRRERIATIKSEYRMNLFYSVRNEKNILFILIFNYYKTF